MGFEGVLCADADSVSLTANVKEVQPGDVFFARSGATEQKTIDAWAVDSSGKKIEKIIIYRLGHLYGKKASDENWWMGHVPDNLSEVKIVVDKAVVVGVGKKVKDSDKDGERFRAARGSFWLLKCFEEDPFVMTGEERKVFEEFLNGHHSAQLSRVSNLILGVATFADLFKQFNNNGPKGAYAPCFKYFEAIREAQDRDPVWGEATRCLMIAKAWSRQYDEAIKLAEELSQTTISAQLRAYGKDALAELPQYKKDNP